MVFNHSGRAFGPVALGDGPVTLGGTAPGSERGTNVLEIHAPPGTRLLSLKVRSPVGADGVD